MEWETRGFRVAKEQVKVLKLGGIFVGIHGEEAGMATGSSQFWKGAALIVVALGLSGCEGQYVLMGNTASMVVTCAMLWGTLKINRPGVGSNRDES